LCILNRVTKDINVHIPFSRHPEMSHIFPVIDYCYILAEWYYFYNGFNGGSNKVLRKIAFVVST
jgi:hypothetical protein